MDVKTRHKIALDLPARYARIFTEDAEIAAALCSYRDACTGAPDPQPGELARLRSAMLAVDAMGTEISRLREALRTIAREASTPGVTVKALRTLANDALST